MLDSPSTHSKSARSPYPGPGIIKGEVIRLTVASWIYTIRRFTFEVGSTMNRALASSLVAAVGVLAGASLAEAQIHERWKLDYFEEKPTLFTYRHPSGELENYWYVYYTVTNNTSKDIPNLLDLTMYVETGRELQSDLRKVDPDAAKAAAGDRTKYEELKYGTFI